MNNLQWIKLTATAAKNFFCLNECEWVMSENDVTLRGVAFRWNIVSATWCRRLNCHGFASFIKKHIGIKIETNVYIYRGDWSSSWPWRCWMQHWHTTNSGLGLELPKKELLLIIDIYDSIPKKIKYIAASVPNCWNTVNVYHMSPGRACSMRQIQANVHLQLAPNAV